VRFGETFDDKTYAYDEATRNLLLYAKHLIDPKSGLLFHAYDETGAQAWADPVTHHSSTFWARSIGWYGMALVDILDTQPKNHPDRAKRIALVQQFGAGVHQIPGSGDGTLVQRGGPAEARGQLARDLGLFDVRVHA